LTTTTIISPFVKCASRPSSRNLDILHVGTYFSRTRTPYLSTLPESFPRIAFNLYLPARPTSSHTPRPSLGTSNAGIISPLGRCLARRLSCWIHGTPRLHYRRMHRQSV